MVHWYPPRRKTGNETSKRLQTSRRSKNNLTSPTTKVKHVQIHGRRVADRVESEHRANPYPARTNERTNTGIYRTIHFPASWKPQCLGCRPPAFRRMAGARVSYDVRVCCWTDDRSGFPIDGSRMVGVWLPGWSVSGFKWYKGSWCCRRVGTPGGPWTRWRATDATARTVSATPRQASP